MSDRKTASYRAVAEEDGNRYHFYCDLSGALVCTTQVYHADTPEDELRLAWETQGKAEFNHCEKCGKWVSDAMYNPEVLECVECAPFEYEPKYCKTCGAKIEIFGKSCPVCGHKLIYEGRPD